MDALNGAWDNFKEGNAPFAVVFIIIGGLGITLQGIRYFAAVRPKKDNSALTSKAQRSKSMAEEYEKRDSQNPFVRPKL
jgi:hypothetical protein